MDSKKRIAIIGAGEVLGQQLAHRLNAQNHMRQAVREIQDEARRQGFECEMYQDEMTFSSANRDQLDALRMALLSNGVKAHHPVRRGEFVDLDFAVYKAEGRGFGYWPQFMGRAHRLQNLPALPHRKPDRQPRGKAFKRMIKLGYQWSGKL